MSRIAKLFRKATGLQKPPLAPTIFRVTAPGRQPPIGASFAESSCRIPGLGSVATPKESEGGSSSSTSTPPKSPLKPPWETDLPKVLPSVIQTSKNPFKGIPLYGYNRHTNLPSSFVQYLPEGEMIQVLPFHYRVAIEDTVEDVLSKRRSSMAEEDAEKVIANLKEMWGLRVPLGEDPIPELADKVEEVKAGASTDAASSGKAKTEAIPEGSTSDAVTAESSTESTEVAVAKKAAVPELPPWIPVRVAPIDMQIDVVSPVPGMASPKLEYSELAMRREWLDKLYLEPSILQLDDSFEGRFGTPPVHMLGDWLDRLEDKYNKWVPRTKDARMELNWAWSPGRVQAARDGTVSLSFSGIGVAPVHEEADSNSAAANLSTSADSTSSSDGSDLPLGMVQVGSPEWKKDLRKRHMARTTLIPALKSMFTFKNRFAAETPAGAEAGTNNGLNEYSPLPEKHPYPNYLRFRYFLDDSLAEYRDGQVGGPAFGGKLIMQRPPGAVPERLEVAPPFCNVTNGQERWEKHRYFGKLAVAASLIYTTGDFTRNQYLHWKTGSQARAIDAEASQRDSSGNSGAGGSGKDSGDSASSDGAGPASPFVPTFLHDNLLFRTYRHFRESDSGKKFNWRKSFIPFIGYQILTAGFVGPFTIWGTWFFVQHAYSAFFVTLSFNLVLWHDLFYL